ncbi:MAG: SET domain-containing protein-lysine N-methyltransferase [Planctomycetes bacterium]|nr:SET domain-containing protein-lysine N-methyltransferase [Planctomycetota bacterium]
MTGSAIPSGAVPRSPLRVGEGARGRGVFALQAFAADADLEECPVILIPAREVGPGVLAHYLFWWDDAEGGRYALPTGHGLLFNYDPEPNTTFRVEPERLAIVFRTLRPIAAGEELLIDYAYDAEHLALLGQPAWYRASGGTT